KAPTHMAQTYGSPNMLSNRRAPATTPEAAYSVKKIRITTADTTRSTLRRSLKRLEKKSGSVSAPRDFSVYMRSRAATNRQFKYAPMISPMAIHDSERPARYTAPGSPMSSQPLMSEAPAASAVTKLPSLRPPRM